MDNSLKQFASLLLRINEKQSAFIGQIVDSKEVSSRISSQAFDLQAEVIIASNNFSNISENLRPVAINQELRETLAIAASVICIVESGMSHAVTTAEVTLVEQMKLCLRRLAELDITPDDAARQMAARMAPEPEATAK